MQGIDVRVIVPVALVLALIQGAGLKIVVVEGEDAVNIIQQRTAVAPIVEVRDRNDLPVAGVSVVFLISGGGASFPGGGEALTVATNAAGRAAASGLTPTGNGAIQINATATHQGETVTATIRQTNFATVQEAQRAGRTPGPNNAAAAAAAGATAGVASGAAAGGGGGMSAATIAVIAGAGVAGAAVAAKALGGSSSSSSTPSGPVSVNASGTFSGNMVVNSSASGPGGVTSCSYNATLSGSLRMALTQQDASVTGTMTGSGTFGVPAQSACGVSTLASSEPIALSGPVTGSPNALRYSQTLDLSQQARMVQSFSGTLSAGVVTGTLTVSLSQQVSIPQPPPFPGTIVVTSTGSATMPVTLR
jgi:hypothetical protein